jgi:hypothetical protein
MIVPYPFFLTEWIKSSSSTTSLTTGALAEKSFVERFLEDKSRSLVPFWGILIRIVAIWGVIFY